MSWCVSGDSYVSNLLEATAAVDVTKDIIFQRRLSWETLLQTDVESYKREALSQQGEIYAQPGYLGCVANFRQQKNFRCKKNLQFLSYATEK